MSVTWLLFNSRIFNYFLILTIVLSYFPGMISSALVTLESIELFKTHEWFKTKPIVYFNCKEENKTVLPDVKEAHVVYTFRGEESWQPLVDLPSKKCKRCGFYEQDSFKSDNVFDEWEFCPSDFTTPDGKYLHVKDGEFNATFLCPQCISPDSAKHASDPHKGGSGKHLLVVIMVSTLVSIVSILGVVAAYKYWLKKKREQEQARFLKLFEDGDENEDELGLSDMI